jgi:formimidoylglutamate deiminase
VDALRSRAVVPLGIAAHSVRAVPAQWLEAIATYADAHGLVRHVHAHEQRKELEETLAEHGCTPIELLHRTGFLGPATSVIHGIHVTDQDIARLAESDTIVVACPTTEGNLGDGFLPAMRYREAGVRLAIGSDSQTRIDPFEETRELETIARRDQESRRGLLATSDQRDLWEELASNGASSLGIAPDAAGEIEIDLDHPDLRGVPQEHLEQALATAASAGVVVRHNRPNAPES